MSNCTDITQDTHWQDIRERAAIAAMQAYICAPILPGVDPNPSREEIVEHSLAIADELVKQLKTKQYGSRENEQST